MVLTGRAVINKKYCTEECSKIDLKDIKPYMENKSGKKEIITYDQYGNESKYIVGIPNGIDFYSDNLRLGLKYSVVINTTGEIENINYNVELAKTKCNYGGYRWWFICPNLNCKKRVRIIYRHPNSRYYACRHCHNLTYRSRQDHRNFLDRFFKFARCFDK